MCSTVHEIKLNQKEQKVKVTTTLGVDEKHQAGSWKDTLKLETSICVYRAMHDEGSVYECVTHWGAPGPVGPPGFWAL